MRSLSPSLPLAALSKLQNTPFKTFPGCSSHFKILQLSLQLIFCFFPLTDFCRFREIVLMGCTLSNRALWLCSRRWAVMPATRRLSTRSTSTFKNFPLFTTLKCSGETRGVLWRACTCEPCAQVTKIYFQAKHDFLTQGGHCSS